MSYHVTDDGEVKKCSAKTDESCPFQTSTPFGSHFRSDFDAAVAARAWSSYANQMAAEQAQFGPQKLHGTMPNINTFANVDAGTLAQIETSLSTKPGEDHFYRSFDIRLVDEDGSMGGDIILTRRRGSDPNFIDRPKEVRLNLNQAANNGDLVNYENFRPDPSGETNVFATARDPYRNSPTWTVSIMEEKELGEITRAPYKSIPIYDERGTYIADHLEQIDDAVANPLSGQATADRSREQLWKVEEVSKQWISMMEAKLDSRKLSTIMPPSAGGRTQNIQGWSASEHSLRFDGGPTQNWNRVSAEYADQNPFFKDQINKGVQYSWSASDTPTGVKGGAGESSVTLTKTGQSHWDLTVTDSSGAQTVTSYSDGASAAYAAEVEITKWEHQYARAKSVWSHNMRLFANGVDEFEGARAMKRAPIPAAADSAPTDADKPSSLFRTGSLMGKLFG